jgi:hypothetical protein
MTLDLSGYLEITVARQTPENRKGRPNKTYWAIITSTCSELAWARIGSNRRNAEKKRLNRIVSEHEPAESGNVRRDSRREGRRDRRAPAAPYPNRAMLTTMKAKWYQLTTERIRVRLISSARALRERREIAMHSLTGMLDPVPMSQPLTLTWTIPHFNGLIIRGHPSEKRNTQFGEIGGSFGV